MGIFILKRKTYSFGSGFVKGSIIGGSIGAILGGASGLRLQAGATLGLVGGLIGGVISQETDNYRKDKESYAKEQENKKIENKERIMRSTIPLWIDDFRNYFNNIVCSESKKIGLAWKQKYGSNKKSLENLEILSEKCYFPTLEYQRHEKIEDNLIPIWFFMGGLENDDNYGCLDLNCYTIYWDYKQSTFIRRSSNKLIPLGFSKSEVTKSIIKLYIEGLTNADYANFKVHLTYDGDYELPCPEDQVKFYVNEFNKAKRAIINFLNNWK